MKNFKIKLVIIVGSSKAEKWSREISNGSKYLKQVVQTKQKTWGRGHSINCHIWQHRWIKYDRRYDMVIYNWWWIVIMCRDKLKSGHS